VAGGSAEVEWNTLFASYAEKHPALASEFTRRMSGGLPAGWKDNLPVYTTVSYLTYKSYIMFHLN
jgi:transketolase